MRKGRKQDSHVGGNQQKQQNLLQHSILCYCKMIMDRGRHGGLMVSALNSGASGPGSSPGRGHCVVFLGKTL